MSYLRAVPRLMRLVTGFAPRRTGFEPRSGHVEFVVNKVALGQVFSEFSPLPILILPIAGTIGQIVADVPSGLSLTLPPETKKDSCNICFVTSIYFDYGPVCSHLLTLVPRSRIFLPWRWRQYVPPKRRFTQYPHGATSQKTAFFIVTAMKISNLPIFFMFQYSKPTQMRRAVREFGVCSS
jgi:hypothetical protein